MKQNQLTRLFRTLAIILFLIGITLPQASFAAGIDFTAKDVTVTEALTKLQQQHGYSVTVKADKVDLSRKVSIDVSNASVQTIVRQIFSGQNVNFTVKGKTIIVTEPAETKKQRNKETSRPHSLSVTAR